MQRDWGKWSPSTGEALSNAWSEMPAAQQCADRSLDDLPDGGHSPPYACTSGGREWHAIDTYNPIEQICVNACQHADDPAAPTLLDPCRDFTYQEFSLLHRVIGLECEQVFHDLGERSEGPTFCDATFLLRRSAPWRPGSARSKKILRLSALRRRKRGPVYRTFIC